MNPFLESQLDLVPGEITEAVHRQWMLVQVPIALGLAAILFLGFMMLLEGGTSGPTFAILNQAIEFYL